MGSWRTAGKVLERRRSEHNSVNPEAPSAALPQRRHVWAAFSRWARWSLRSRSIVVMFFGDDGGRQYKLMFQTGGQLVPGNEVLVAGQPVGTVDSIDLIGRRPGRGVGHDGPPDHRGHDRADPPRPRSRASPTATSRSRWARTDEEIARRRHARGGRDDVTGRPRPALRHLRRRDPGRATELLQGPGHRLHGQHRGSAQHLQVLRPEPAGGRAPARGGEPRPGRPEPLPGPGRTTSSAPSPTGATTSPTSPRTETRRLRLSPPRTRRSTGPSPPCPPRCARRTPRSSTCARRSTTLTR